MWRPQTNVLLSFLISFSLVLCHARFLCHYWWHDTVSAAQSGGASNLAPPGFYSHTCGHKMVSLQLDGAIEDINPAAQALFGGARRAKLETRLIY